MRGNTRSPARRREALIGVLVAATVALAVPACSSAPGDPAAPGSASAQPPPAALTRQDVDAWLDGVVPTALRSSGIPGAAVSVVADGRILTTRGYGAADTGAGGGGARPVDGSRTLFRIGSVSKTFTATAVMQLVQQGRLDLDADVHRYLDFPLPTPKGSVTLRTLLTHTAGFEERGRGLITTGTGESLRDFVAHDVPEQVFTPGTTPAYSNYGYSLAGYVVERVSGVPFATYVDREVMRPVGMTSSTAAQPVPATLATRLAQGYPDDSARPIAQEFVAASPAGAVSATAEDMGRYLLGQLGRSPDGGLLDPDTLRLMHTPALGARTLGSLAEGPRMTLGFFDQDRNGHRALGHDGDTQAFHASMRFYPQDGVGVFLAVNGNGRVLGASSELRTNLQDAFADRYLPAHAGARTGDDRVDTTLSDTQKHADATATAGTYVNTRGAYSNFTAILGLQGQAQVTANADGTLTSSAVPGAPGAVRLEEIRPHLWRQVGGQLELATRGTGRRIDAILADGAFTMERGDAAHDGRTVVPLVIAFIVVLVGAVVAGPVVFLRRRIQKVPAPPRTARGRVARRLTGIAVVATLAGLAGWAYAIMELLRFHDVPDAPLRLFQVLQLIGLLGVVPSTVGVVDAARRRCGVAVVAARSLVLVALGGIGFVAVTFAFLAPSVSY